MAGTTYVNYQSTTATNIALNLNKTAGNDAIAGNLQVNNASTSAGSQSTVLWSANNQVNDNSVITLNPTAATAKTILRLNGKSDTIGGLVSAVTATGIAIVENESGTANGTLTVNPALGNTHAFAGIIRNGDGTGVDGTLALSQDRRGYASSRSGGHVQLHRRHDRRRRHSGLRRHAGPCSPR